MFLLVVPIKIIIVDCTFRGWLDVWALSCWVSSACPAFLGKQSIFMFAAVYDLALFYTILSHGKQRKLNLALFDMTMYVIDLRCKSGLISLVGRSMQHWNSGYTVYLRTEVQVDCNDNCVFGQFYCE